MSKAEKTRQSILERSAAIFNKKGIAGTAMSDIMEATGLAKGSLYVHFEDKDKLSQAATAYMLGMQKQRVERATAMQETAREKLIAFFRSSVAPSDLAIPGGCAMLNLGLEADDTNPAIRRQVLAMTDAMQEEITRLVKLGVRNGEFNAGFQAENFAVRSFAMLEGGIFLSKISGNGKKLALIVKAIVAEIDANAK